jgi:hypothetical protein
VCGSHLGTASRGGSQSCWGSRGMWHGFALERCGFAEGAWPAVAGRLDPGDHRGDPFVRTKPLHPDLPRTIPGALQRIGDEPLAEPGVVIVDGTDPVDRVRVVDGQFTDQGVPHPGPSAMGRCCDRHADTDDVDGRSATPPSHARGRPVRRTKVTDPEGSHHPQDQPPVRRRRGRPRLGHRQGTPRLTFRRHRPDRGRGAGTQAGRWRTRASVCRSEPPHVGRPHRGHLGLAIAQDGQDAAAHRTSWTERTQGWASPTATLTLGRSQ